MSNQGDDSVSVIDVRQLAVIKEIDVGAYPEGIDRDAKGERLYVSNWMDGTVSVIDPIRGVELSTFTAGEGSRAFGRFFANVEPP